MDAILLYYRGQPLREFLLDGGPKEVGSGPGCDIVVHDDRVDERQLLVAARHGVVEVLDLRRSPGGRRRWRTLVYDEPFAVGEHYSLVRIREASLEPRTPQTFPLAVADVECCGVTLLVGRGSGARRVRLGDRPLYVGSGPDNDVVLEDRTVSARHCRVDVRPGGIDLRDLGSRNGTWIDGVRVEAGAAGAGSVLRVGRTELLVVARGASGDARHGEIVATSPVMLRVLAEMERSARLSWPILVEGESGVGKELIAHALHRRGPRAEGPFVAINAGGLPRDLIESELFGHERGAFTGATGVKRGVFEQAHGGTLFLDEIGELPLDLQTRLLRVLETWRIRRVGAEDSREVDVRLVCATHRDVRVEVERGRFRTDLYYRIARLVIDVPPLRERGGDISILANHFLRLVSAEVGARVLSRDAMTKLESYSWPGNVRELRNVVAAAAAATACGVIDGDDIDRVLGRLMGKGALSESDAAILQVVERHRGNLSAAARALGVPRSTLRDRLKGLKRAAPVAARRAARAG